MSEPKANSVFTLGITVVADREVGSEARGGNENINRLSQRRVRPKTWTCQQCCEKAAWLAFAVGLTLLAGLTPRAFGAPRSAPRGDTTRTEAARMASTRPNKDGRPTIVLRIYNLVHLPPRPLMAAERKAGWILAAAGLEDRWLDCSLTAAEVAQYPHCGQPMPPQSLVFYIVSDRMASGLPAHTDTLGWALACPREALDCFAYIFYDRIQSWVGQSGKVTPYEILGRTIAHEVGHLLLGPNSHSLSGIMRAAWNPEDLAYQTGASLSSFLFTFDQAKKLRTEVTTRTAAQE